jgi:hypothetical protein
MCITVLSILWLAQNDFLPDLTGDKKCEAYPIRLFSFIYLYMLALTVVR